MSQRTLKLGMGGLATIAAATMLLEAAPSLSPRFAEQPWDTRGHGAWRGRKTKRPNRSAKKQAAAKKARKITARSRRPAAQRASKEGREDGE